MRGAAGLADTRGKADEGMTSYEATNDDFLHLDDGLPTDIARLKDAGELGRAVRLIEAELAPSSPRACVPSVPACCGRRWTLA